jgi:transglutaminase-like putative cysteine protease
MLKTVLLYVSAATVIAWNWLRLEEGGHAAGRAAWIVLLALAPALLRGRAARIAVGAFASVLAVSSAFDVPLRHVASGRPFSRFWNGFLEFYDVRLPFDPARHPRMHDVLLLAVFAACLLVGLAIASRRTMLAAVLMIVTAGWPATLLDGAELFRGAVILAVVLAFVFALGGRGQPALVPAAASGGALVLAAVVVSTSSAIAGKTVLNWQNWDFYNRQEAPVGVRYVWDSSFRGIRFPKKRTTVLRIQAPLRATYWRATALEEFDGARWREHLVPMFKYGGDGRDEMTGDPLLPVSASHRSKWVRQTVHVVSLRDRHLVAASIPVAFSRNTQIEYANGQIAVAPGFMPPGARYEAWSYQPRPTPQALARSRPFYPSAAEADLEVAPGVETPSFGSPRRAAAMQALFNAHRFDPRIAPYRAVYRTALSVVGTRTPYGAAVGLEAWFRSGGGFRYDTQPPPVNGPPLAAFVTTTRRGYCQHFAGAMALMLRYLGIPARVAAGFTSGRYSHNQHEWVVTDHDAHTWVEVWFDGYGWLPFDPTPDRGTLTGAYTSASPTFDAGGALLALAARAGLSGASVLQRLRRQSRGPNGRAPDLRGASKGPRLDRGGHSRWPVVGLLSLFAFAAVAVIPATKLAVRRARYLSRDPRRLASACVRELSDVLADQGVDVRSGMSVGEVAAAAESELGAEAASFAAAASAARYGPLGGAADAAKRAREELKSVRADLRERLTGGERLRGLVSVRSLGLS